ncbi:hypothetical protein V6N11_051100 [Hibiscus sabdariffa]|uniref:Uncharacterized protein n=2 Tax=Hibiscus sabdariffa TaxID=183260 RepID=A0ABR2R2V5_9ROSI
MSGFDANLLAKVLNIDTRLARKLQNERDNRGAIVRVKHEIQSQKQSRKKRGNKEVKRGRKKERDMKKKKEEGNEENINAYNIVYVAIGNERVEIVSKNREAIFDDQVQEGQVITVPQNHAVLKKAGRQGFEWIAFKTKANAKISQLVCSLSVMRGLPVDVLSNSFVISWEEASKFEENKHKVSVFSPRRGSQE